MEAQSGISSEYLIPYRLQNAERREGGAWGRRSERIFKSDSNKREITEEGRESEGNVKARSIGRRRTEEYPITAETGMASEGRNWQYIRN